MIVVFDVKRRQVVSTSKRVPVPEALVSACQDAADTATEYFVKRKRGRRWVSVGDPVMALREEEAVLAEVKWNPQDHTPENYAAELYDLARDDATSEGEGHYQFTGVHAIDDRTGEELFCLTLHVETDEDGEASVSPVNMIEGSTAGLERAIGCVEKLAALLERSHRSQVVAGEKQFDQIESLRSQLQLHYAERSEIEETRAEIAAEVMQHSAQLKKMEALGDTLQGIVTQFGPIFAARWKSNQDRPKAEPEPQGRERQKEKPEMSEPITLCQDAGVVDRILSRLDKVSFQTFRGAFNDAQWLWWERARGATVPSDFDDSFVGLLRESGVSTREEAGAVVTKWGEYLPTEEVQHMAQVLFGLSSRISFPLENA